MVLTQCLTQWVCTQELRHLGAHITQNQQHNFSTEYTAHRSTYLHNIDNADSICRRYIIQYCDHIYVYRHHSQSSLLLQPCSISDTKVTLWMYK